LLLELRNIKKSLIKSSKDIERVFKLPLQHLRINNKVIAFSIEDIHREEFTNTLIKDEFIYDLIIQIQTISQQLKIDEINHLIEQIEEDVSSNKKEMTRFSAFLNAQLKSFIESDEDDSNQEENTEDAVLNHEQELIQRYINKETLHNDEEYDDSFTNNSKKYLNTNSSKSVSPNPDLKHMMGKTKYASNDVDIDELVEYIVKEEEKPKKKQKEK